MSGSGGSTGGVGGAYAEVDNDAASWKENGGDLGKGCVKYSISLLVHLLRDIVDMKSGWKSSAVS